MERFLSARARACLNMNTLVVTPAALSLRCSAPLCWDPLTTLPIITWAKTEACGALQCQWEADVVTKSRADSVTRESKMWRAQSSKLRTPSPWCDVKAYVTMTSCETKLIRGRGKQFFKLIWFLQLRSWGDAPLSQVYTFVLCDKKRPLFSALYLTKLLLSAEWKMSEIDTYAG